MYKIDSITLEPESSGLKSVTLLTNTRQVYTMPNIERITGNIKNLLIWPIVSASMLTKKSGEKVYQLYTERSCISFFSGVQNENS